MSQNTIIALVPVIALVLGAVFVFLDVYTNPINVEECRAQRDKQLWVTRNTPTQLFPRTARNIHRHRRMY